MNMPGVVVIFKKNPGARAGGEDAFRFASSKVIITHGTTLFG
jgi:hypothetical protein